MLKRTIILLAIVTGLVACNEDLLNVENPNVPTEDTFWGTLDDAQKGLTAVYSQFTRVGNWSRWIYFRYDLTSDMGFSNSPWNELKDWTQFKYVNYNFIQGGKTIFKGHYKQIFQCNQLIAFAPDAEVQDEAEATLLNQIIAQAKFIRAFDYFNLLILFENLPIVLEPSSAGDKPEVGGPEIIYPIIIQDLEDAIMDLPEEWTGADKGRVTKGAAYALLGKVYMQQHQWQQAREAFDHLVTGELAGYYGLMDDYRDNFTHLNENNMESVFEIQFTDANETVMDRNNGSDIDEDVSEMALGNTRSQFFAPTGWKDGNPRPWLIDEYKREQTVDPLENGNYFDTRLVESILYPEMFDDFPNVSLFAGKFTKWPFTWGRNNLYFRKYGDDYFKERTDYFSPINYRVIRYADVLLCYAECLAQLDDVATAVSYVDQIRTRPSTNLPPMAQSTDAEIAASINSKETFLKRLEMERALELSLESVRWIDLRRWGYLETQEGINELISRDADFENFELGKHHILPLPQFEVDNNPNMEQNPGY